VNRVGGDALGEGLGLFLGCGADGGFSGRLHRSNVTNLIHQFIGRNVIENDNQPTHKLV
jgi:hypothetical protein